ncbi:hypothetical protein Tco_0637517 [Tanacetum coccineum]
MTETMEKYMSKTRGNYGSGVIRPKINDKTHFDLKGQYLKELHKNTFSGSEHKDANEYIEKVLEIVDLFHIPEVTQDQVMLRVFPMSLTGAASRWLRNEPSGAIPTKTVADAKIAIQEMGEYSQKWHNRTSSKARSTETSDGLAAIQAQLNNLGIEIKKVNEKVYAAQQIVRENSNIIKEIQASTDAAIRNQGASIKTLEIQIGQMSKVLQERGIGGLPGSTEPNPMDHVKSISTAKADSSEIRRMGCSPYAVSGSQHKNMFSETIPFPRRLQNYLCDDWRKA